MKGVKELKSRLGSVGNIRKVTSTMELVATAKLKKLQLRAQATRPYAEAIRTMMGRVAGYVSAETSPLLREPEAVTRERVIVIAADKGLCGAFNANVLRKATEYVRARQAAGVEVSVYALGRRAEKFFRKIGVPVVGTVDEKLESVDYRRVAVAMRGMAEEFVADGVQRVTLVFTRFVSAVTFVPTVETILPLAAPEATVSGPKFGRYLWYEMEPTPEAIMERLIPKATEMMLYSGVLESLASEVASRRVAMKNATDAATDMIDELRMEYNKARQAGITSELLEITAGAEALKG